MTDVNPHKPGSEDWHRFNLGIPQGAVGLIDTVLIGPDGLKIKGWFWGEAAKMIQDQEMKHYSIYGPINAPKKSGLSGYIGRLLHRDR